MGLIRKLRNRLFQNLEFCIHDATLGADLARCGCRMDMVDGALERVDVACFNPNIEIVSWCLFLLENSFEFRDFSKFPGLRFSKKKHCCWISFSKKLVDYWIWNQIFKFFFSFYTNFFYVIFTMYTCFFVKFDIRKRWLITVYEIDFSSFFSFIFHFFIDIFTI